LVLAAIASPEMRRRCSSGDWCAWRFFLAKVEARTCRSWDVLVELLEWRWRRELHGLAEAGWRM